MSELPADHKKTAFQIPFGSPPPTPPLCTACEFHEPPGRSGIHWCVRDEDRPALCEGERWPLGLFSPVEGLWRYSDVGTYSRSCAGGCGFEGRFFAPKAITDSVSEVT